MGNSLLDIIEIFKNVIMKIIWWSGCKELFSTLLVTQHSSSLGGLAGSVSALIVIRHRFESHGSRFNLSVAK